MTRRSAEEGVGKFVGGKRAAYQVALDAVAALFKQQFALQFVLHAFGDHGHAKIVRQYDDGLADGGIVVVAG